MTKQQTMGERLGKFLKTPKGYVLGVLLVLMLFGGFGANELNGIVDCVVAMVTGVVLDFVVALVLRRKVRLSDGGLLTGLIVGLVLSSQQPWYAAAVTTAIGLVVKHLLKIKRKPLFNPAAIGLLAATFLFPAGQSWWGGMAMLPAWCIVMLLVGGYLVTHRVNKFPAVFAFLGVYFLLQLLLGIWNVGDAADALRNPFLNTALFLGFFMVTDPPTSPAQTGDQVWFGVVTAIVSVLLYLLWGGLGYMLVGLLVGNAWNGLRAAGSSSAASSAV